MWGINLYWAILMISDHTFGLVLIVETVNAVHLVMTIEVLRNGNSCICHNGYKHTHRGSIMRWCELWKPLASLLWMGWGQAEQKRVGLEGGGWEGEDPLFWFWHWFCWQGDLFMVSPSYFTLGRNTYRGICLAWWTAVCQSSEMDCVMAHWLRHLPLVWEAWGSKPGWVLPVIDSGYLVAILPDEQHLMGSLQRRERQVGPVSTAVTWWYSELLCNL